MYIAKLQLHCMNCIIQHVCENFGNKPSDILLNQLHQCGGIVDVFTHQILNEMVKRYPLMVTDKIIQILCHESLKYINLRSCKNISLSGLEIVLNR